MRSNRRKKDEEKIRTLEVAHGSTTVIESLLLDRFSAHRLTHSRVYLPQTIQQIGDKCFEDCPILTEVCFGSNSRLKQICKASFANASLRSIFIPRTVQVLEESCFSPCESLMMVSFEVLPFQNPLSINFWSEAMAFGDEVFGRSNLQWIMIPWRVVEIGRRCFRSCSSLFHIGFEGDLNEIRFGEESFSQTGIKEFVSSTTHKMVAFDRPSFRLMSKLSSRLLLRHSLPYFGFF
jgi:hypothetical protein